MPRNCTIIRTSESFPNKHICIDDELHDELFPILNDEGKYEEKFHYISVRILENANMYFDDYKRIYNEKGIKISEMRFFPNGDNCRIYCKEVSFEGNIFCIIMAKYLPKKKPKKIDNAIKQIIEVIKGYEYEIPH